MEQQPRHVDLMTRHVLKAIQESEHDHHDGRLHVAAGTDPNIDLDVPYTFLYTIHLPCTNTHLYSTYPHNA